MRVSNDLLLINASHSASIQVVGCAGANVLIKYVWRVNKLLVSLQGHKANQSKVTLHDGFAGTPREGQRVATEDSRRPKCDLQRISSPWYLLLWSLAVAIRFLPFGFEPSMTSSKMTTGTLSAKSYEQ